MSDVCYCCGKVPAEDPEVSFIEGHVNWDTFAAETKAGEKYTQRKYVGYNSYSRKTEYTDGETFTLLQKQTFAQESQGETTDCFLVFRRENTDKTYKKLGKGDSYGDLEWDGALFEVQVAKKMVETWEVVEGN